MARPDGSFRQARRTQSQTYYELGSPEVKSLGMRLNSCAQKRDSGYRICQGRQDRNGPIPSDPPGDRSKD